MRLIDTSKNVLLITTLHLDTTARLSMALTDNGCAVSVMCPPGHWVKYIRRVHRRLSYSWVRPLHALKRAILAVQPDLIIPCDDRAVRDMHALLRHTKDRRIRAILTKSLGDPDFDMLRITTTRDGLMNEAERLGVPVPVTRLLDKRSDLRNWDLLGHPFPWVIKADGTWAGAGVRIVNSMTEAEAAFDEMSQPVSMRSAISEAIFDWNFFWIKPWLRRQTHALTIQSYIPGYPANCAVFAKNGEITGFVAVEVERAESRTGPASVVKIVNNPQMFETAAIIVRALGYTGVCGFDFMINDSTRVPYLIEMNPRNVPLGHIALGPGRDIVEAITAFVDGRALRARSAVTTQECMTYFPTSWKRDPTDRVINQTYHDVPWEEGELMRQLLRPETRERPFVRRARQFLGARKREATGEATTAGL